MKKRLLALLLAFLCMPLFAENNGGYVYSAYGELVKNAYGGCIHTAYFDPQEGLAECGEGPGSDVDTSTGG